MKFKVGDKVKSIECSEIGYFDVGQIFEVLGVDSDDTILIRLPNGKKWWSPVEKFQLIPVTLPINITFKNKYEHQAMQQFLFDNGCKWCYSGNKLKNYDKCPITISENRDINNNGEGYIYSDNEAYPTFTFNDIDTIKEILNPSKPITKLVLNESHTAEIDPNTETVKVGSQTFTFDKIKELYKAVNP